MLRTYWRAATAVALTLLPFPLVAQETVEGPFFRFTKVVPGGNLDQTGQRSVLSYFASTKGQIADIQLDAMQDDTGSADSTRLAGRHSASEVVCEIVDGEEWCWTIGGPQGNIVLVAVRPVRKEGSLDFEVSIQEPFQEGSVLFNVDGFTATDDGSLVPKSMD